LAAAWAGCLLANFSACAAQLWLAPGAGGASHSVRTDTLLQVKNNFLGKSSSALAPVPRIKLPGRRLLRLSRSGLQNQRQNLVRANFAASKSKNQKLLWGGN